MGRLAASIVLGACADSAVERQAGRIGDQLRSCAHGRAFDEAFGGWLARREPIKKRKTRPNMSANFDLAQNFSGLN